MSDARFGFVFRIDAHQALGSQPGCDDTADPNLFTVSNDPPPAVACDSTVLSTSSHLFAQTEDILSYRNNATHNI
jgi:hypothetical protein